MERKEKFALRAALGFGIAGFVLSLVGFCNCNCDCGHEHHRRGLGHRHSVACCEQDECCKDGKCCDKNACCKDGKCCCGDGCCCAECSKTYVDVTKKTVTTVIEHQRITEDDVVAPPVAPAVDKGT